MDLILSMGWVTTWDFDFYVLTSSVTVEDHYGTSLDRFSWAPPGKTSVCN